MHLGAATCPMTCSEGGSTRVCPLESGRIKLIQWNPYMVSYHEILTKVTPYLALENREIELGRLTHCDASDAIWWHRSGSTLTQVMACCLTAPSHYLNQFWFVISEVPWHLPESNITESARAATLYDEFEKYSLKNLCHISQGSMSWSEDGEGMLLT